VNVKVDVGEPEDDEGLRIDSNPDVIKSGTKSFGNTVIRYADVPLEQYDYYTSDAIDIVDKDYFGFIGSVLASFSEFEHLLDECIVKMTSDRSDDRGLRIASMFTFMQKLNYLVNDILPLLEGVKATEFKKLHKAGVAAIETRNLVAHANWSTLTYDGFVRCDTRTDKDGWIYFRYYEFTGETLSGIQEDIDLLCRSLVQFIKNNETLSEILYDIADYYTESS
jgi:hypothetical protein